ncbi:MAG: thiamine phosphate synthase [Nitrospirota bacterium]
MNIDFKLYLITDRALFSTQEMFFTAIEHALEGGVKVVQLREKDMPTRQLLSLAYKMREMTAHYNAKLIINDRADIALSVAADGVHLGQAGMPAFAVRKVIGDMAIIGVSTHTMEEAIAAEQEGADFITFGPLYDTPSKRAYGRPVGVEQLKKVAGKVSLPVFGIGGIKETTIGEVIGHGAQGIALISGILGASDVRAAAVHYLKEVGE